MWTEEGENLGGDAGHQQGTNSLQAMELEQIVACKKHHDQMLSIQLSELLTWRSVCSGHMISQIAHEEYLVVILEIRWS